MFWLDCLPATHEIHGVAGGGGDVGGDRLGGVDVGGDDCLAISVIISSIRSFTTIIISSVGVLLVSVSSLCFFSIFYISSNGLSSSYLLPFLISSSPPLC